jgi:hypothetical protein
VAEKRNTTRTDGRESEEGGWRKDYDYLRIDYEYYDYI